MIVGRVYTYFETSLPTADCNIVRGIIGTDPGVTFKASDGKIYASTGSSLGATGVAVSPGQWYRIDYKFDTSANTFTADAKVDGVACGQKTVASAASFMTSIRIGFNIFGTTANGTMYMTDHAVSQTVGDYPIGPGAGIALYPNADGAHVFDTAGDFKYENTTNVGTGATDTFSHVNSVLDTTIGNFISVNAASNTEYLEWAFTDLPSITSINGIHVSLASHSSSTAANKQTLQLNDNGTLSDVCTDLDQSQTTICYHSKQYTTAPSTGGAWTKALADGLLARWNSSYGTVGESPIPFIDGVCLEVDYVPGIAALPGRHWTLLRKSRK